VSTSQDDSTATTGPVEEPVVPYSPAARKPPLGARAAAWRRQREAADDDDRARPRVGSTAVHPVSGQSLRAALSIGLTFAVVLMVFLGLILRLPPADFAQYMAPLTGIAGLALGYWFGSDKSR